MNPEQFVSYLFRGLGRTYLHLQHHDSLPYSEALLHACLYNPVYDRQCEGSRATYLIGLIKLTHDQTTFKQRILDAFSVLDEDMDAEQLFDFALTYAQAGNSQARHLMYEQFAAHAGDGNDVGTTQLIDLDGIDGFRFVAARLGEAARLDPEFWDTDYLLTHLKKRSPSVTDTDIAALGDTDASIQRYLALVARNTAHREQASQQRLNTFSQSYEEIKAQLVAAKKQNPHLRLKRWGKSASSEDIEIAAQDLLKQDDPHLLASYLAMFVQRQFPLGIQPLLPFVRHSNDRVARWALDALSLFRDPILRDVALELLRDNQLASDALSLFNLNYQVGDEEAFVSLLDKAQLDDEVHAIGFGLIDILAHTPVLRASEILFALYEQEPCSLCRTKVVKLLGGMKAIPDWMIHECHYDADEDTRAIVQHYQARSEND